MAACYVGPMATYIEQSLAKLKEFEGCVPWMYLDTAGKVTVGVGTMLPSPQAAAALPFQNSGAAIPAGKIIAEFHRVAAMPSSHLPAFYREPTSPQLPMYSIEDRLRCVLVAFETDLRQHLPRYDALPDRAKLGLLDMAYNLGVSGLVRGYPRLLAAISVGNWTEAAAECLRHGISSERNTWTRVEFLAAAAAIGVVTEIRAAAAELRLVLRWAAVATAVGLLVWVALRAKRRPQLNGSAR